MCLYLGGSFDKSSEAAHGVWPPRPYRYLHHTQRRNRNRRQRHRPWLRHNFRGTNKNARGPHWSGSGWHGRSGRFLRCLYGDILFAETKHYRSLLANSLPCLFHSIQPYVLDYLYEHQQRVQSLRLHLHQLDSDRSTEFRANVFSPYEEKTRKGKNLYIL